MDISTEAQSNCSDVIIETTEKVDNTHYVLDDAEDKLSKSSSGQVFIGECKLSDSASVAVESPFELQPRPIKCNRYGWGCFTPAILQPIFNNAKTFLIFVTIANVIHGIIVNGLVKVNVTSIERHFQLLSSESGIIISSYDIAGCLCLLPMSYIGGRGHKPRWISVGVFLIAVGTIILALPNFIIEPYQYKLPSVDDKPGLCGGDRSTNITSNDTPHNHCIGQSVNPTTFHSMKYVFILGQFVLGIGSSPLSILAVTMIDESVNQKVYPIHIGIFYLGALVGPAMGFIFGGKLLTIFTNVNEPPSDINPESPMWVGAWWIGFLVSGVLAFLLCIPLFGYPSKLGKPSRGGCSCYVRKKHKVEHCVTMQEMLPRNEDLKKHDIIDSQVGPSWSSVDGRISVETFATRATSAKTASSQAVKNFCSDLIQVVSNKAFMFLSLSAAIFSTLVSGFSTFGPKFIESQLGKSAADAANLFGYVCIPAGASGMLIGAFLMVGLKMNHKTALQMCIAVSAVSLLAHFVLILDCPDPHLAGVSVPYPHLNLGNSHLSNFTVLDSCNRDCSCNRDLSFNPVCGDDLITYYSPCYAGCSLYNSTRNAYSHCTCLTSGFSDVKPGICSRVCQWETLMLFSLFIIILSTFLCTVPGVDISLRCFPSHQRSLAIGIQWILIRTLGTIPGPILFGAVIDGACLVMDKASCNSKGSCVLYKNSKLSSSFLVLSFTYKVAGIVTLSLALLYVGRCAVDNQTSSQSSRKLLSNPVSPNRAGHEQEDQSQMASSN